MLYTVLFSASLGAEQAVRTVALLADLSDEQRRQMVTEIRLELDEPTQQVRDIVENPQSEEELRRFLALTADLLLADGGTR